MLFVVYLFNKLNDLICFFSTDFLYTPGVTTIPMIVHGCIVRWFGDGSGRDGVSPLSLHQMVDCGRKIFGKQPGEWYSPSHDALSIRFVVLYNIYWHMVHM